MHLPPDERDEILVACLAQDEDILIDEVDELHDILRCEYYVGGDNNGKLLAKEAAKVYYRNNCYASC